MMRGVPDSSLDISLQNSARLGGVALQSPHIFPETPHSSTHMGSERRFDLPDVPPLEFFGVGHRKFATLKSHFPKLKLVGRGNEVKALGSKDDLDQFSAKWDLIVWHLERYG